jgi:hypothetical protein
LRQTDRRWLDAEHDDGGAADAAVRGEFEQSRGTGDGEIAVAAGIFVETTAMATRPAP